MVAPDQEFSGGRCDNHKSKKAQKDGYCERERTSSAGWLFHALPFLFYAGVARSRITKLVTLPACNGVIAQHVGFHLHFIKSMLENVADRNDTTEFAAIDDR